MRKRKGPRSIVVISDTHCGCKLALCPPSGAPLDEGGLYKPSPMQLKLWAMWREFWGKTVPEWVGDEPWDLVHNGDAIEGTHHKASTPITHNLNDHVRLADLVMRPVVDACRKSGGDYLHIRGTEVHVGQSADREEQLARDLGATPDEFGMSSRWELWHRFQGGLVNFKHHIGTTSSAGHESTAIWAEKVMGFVEAGRFGDEPACVDVRSHRHRYMKVEGPAAWGSAISVVTPAWQLKTPHVWKIAGGRNSQPQIGGIVIKHGHTDGLYTRSRVWRIERSREFA